MRRFEAGDAIRGLAALMIFVFHVTVYTASRGGTLGGVAREPLVQHQSLIFGELGTSIVAQFSMSLYVFFVLSGYLIARPFVQCFVAGKPQPSLRRYLRNRVLRIVPAFWVVATVVILICTFAAGWIACGRAEPVHHTSPLAILSVYAFAQMFFFDQLPLARWDFGPAWSLHVEVVFYALVPLAAAALVVLLGRRGGERTRLWLILVGCAASVIVSLLVRQALPHTPFNLRQFHANLFAFAPGIALAAIEPWMVRLLSVSDGDTKSVARRERRVRAGAFTLVALAIGCLLVLAILGLHPEEQVSGAGIAMIGTGAVVAAPLYRQWGGLRPWRALTNPFFEWVGQRSYSFYLVHGLAIALAANLGVGSAKSHWFITLAGGLSIASGLAWLSYRFVELPFLHRRGGHVATAATLASQPARG